MKMDGITFTIIVATYNAASTLPVLFASLSLQTYTNFEVIVQDGASTDTTLDVVEQYKNAIFDISAFCSQDNGIFDAWNKSLPHIRGEWVLFMGADDTLCSPDSLEQLFLLLQNLPTKIDYASFPVRVVLQDGTFVENLCPSLIPEKDLAQKMCLPHQGLLHRSRLFSTTHFDTSFRIAGDYDFVCRTLVADGIYFGSTPFVNMSVGGVSGRMENMWQRELEFLRVSRKYFPSALPWKNLARLCLSVVYKTIASSAGEKANYYFADFVRKIQGKPKLWANVYEQEHSAKKV